MIWRWGDLNLPVRPLLVEHAVAALAAHDLVTAAQDNLGIAVAAQVGNWLGGVLEGNTAAGASAAAGAAGRGLVGLRHCSWSCGKPAVLGGVEDFERRGLVVARG